MGTFGLLTIPGSGLAEAVNCDFNLCIVSECGGSSFGMRIFNSRISIISFSVLFSAAVFTGPSAIPSAYAFDPEKQFSEDDEPRSILRFGFMALKQGNFEEAISAFRFGAAKNDLASQWKLARMLQTGAGLPKDDLAAYRLYAKIANPVVAFSNVVIKT